MLDLSTAYVGRTSTLGFPFLASEHRRSRVQDPGVAPPPGDPSVRDI
jgi:hypothetical protein